MPRPKTGGRRAGTPNKATADIKAVARIHGPAAITRLAELAGLVQGQLPAGSEQAQVSAAKELLDRGYGKATQLVGGDPDSGPIKVTWESE